MFLEKTMHLCQQILMDSVLPVPHGAGGTWTDTSGAKASGETWMAPSMNQEKDYLTIHVWVVGKATMNHPWLGMVYKV